MNAKVDVRIPLPPLLIVILSVVASAKAISYKPLLDERFLLAWAHPRAGITGFDHFVSFSGLVPGEVWGPLTPISIKLSQVLSFGVPWLWRFHNMLLFVGGSLALLYLFRRLIPNVFVAMFITMLIAVGITFLEPVLWLGARGFVLAYFLVSLSLALYARPREQGSLLWISLGCILFGIALMAEFNVWMFALLFALIEYVIWKRLPKEKRKDGTIHLVAPMVPLVLSACALAALGFRFTAPAWKPLKFSGEQGRFAAKLHSTFKNSGPVVIADMPEKLSTSPLFTTDGAVLYDPASGTISSTRISGGILKSHIAGGSAPVPFYRWNRTHGRFTAVSWDFDNAAEPAEFDAKEIAAQSQPPIPFIKTTSLDEQANELTIKSEMPTTGPVLRISGSWLNPGMADFVWIDAKVDSPRKESSSLELYWVTLIEPEYDARARRETVPAVVNDGQYHRYYFPVTSTPWYSSSLINQLTLGFPAQSSVIVKRMGTITKDQISPKVSIDIASSERAIAAPNFGFPNMPQLGLYVAPRGADSIPVRYALQTGADGILFEIALPGRDFENPNGSRISGVTWKTVPIEKPGPTAQLDISDLPQTAVYAIRAVAMDKEHNPIGNFSDTLYVLVDRPPQFGWSTR